MNSFVQYWFTADMFAVGFSSYFGVFIRMTLSEVFRTPSSPSTSDPSILSDPLIQLFYFRHHLVPNLLGSFLMALFISNTQRISKVSLPLFKALTTGLCGCITTFSSWINYSVRAPFNAHWFNIFIIIILEVWLTWSAFTMGFAFSKLWVSSVWPVLQPWWQRTATLLSPTAAADIPTRRDIEMVQEAAEKDFAVWESISANHQVLNHTPFSSTEIIINSFLVQEHPTTAKSSNSLSKTPLKRDIHSGKGCKFDAVLRAPPSPSKSLSADSSAPLYQPLPSTDVAKESTNSKTTLHQRSQLVSDVGSAPIQASRFVKLHHLSGMIDVWREDGSDPNSAPETADRTFQVVPNASKHVEITQSTVNSNVLSRTSTVMTIEALGQRDVENNNPPHTAPQQPSTALAALLTTVTQVVGTELRLWGMLFALTSIAVWIALACYENRGDLVRTSYFTHLLRAVALAPIGAWTRWGLTRLPDIKKSWPDMNPQTVIANIAAVLLSCLLLVLAPHWDWTAAIVSGVCGCCSTVSTLFAELHGLYFEKGPYAALRYGLTTYLLAIFVIQVIRASEE